MLADPTAYRKSSTAQLREVNSEDVQSRTLLNVYYIEQNSVGYSLGEFFYFPKGAYNFKRESGCYYDGGPVVDRNKVVGVFLDGIEHIQYLTQPVMVELGLMTANINKVLRVGRLTSASSIPSEINPVRVSTLLGDCQIRQIIGIR